MAAKDKRTKAELLEEIFDFEGMVDFHKAEVTKRDKEIADLRVKISILERENNRLETLVEDGTLKFLRVTSFHQGKIDGLLTAFKAITETPKSSEDEGDAGGAY